MGQPNYESVPAAERWRGIGGSGIAALLGMDPYRGPIDLYHEQVAVDDALQAGREIPREELTPADPRWWGTEQEPVIVKAWRLEHPDLVVLYEPGAGPIGTVRSKEHPFWRATPDALAYDRERHGAWVVIARGQSRTQMPNVVTATCAVPPDVLIECKAHGRFVRDRYGEEGTDDVPDDKRAQVYWTGGLLGVDVAEAAVLFDTNRRQWFRVPVDRDALADMLDVADHFMREHVAKRIPPPADGSPSFERHLKARFAQDDGTVAIASDAIADDVAEIRRLKIAVDMAETEIALRSQRVRNVMGAATTLKEIGGKVLATWKRDSRGKVAHKSVADELAARLGMTDREREILDERHRGEAVRPFKIK